MTSVTETNPKILFWFTDLNPCLDVHCPSFGVCKTFSAHEARCVCYEDCPSYHDPVCTANGTTYDNKCWHELYYCRGLENNLVYHPGSCEGKNEASVKWTMDISVLIWYLRKSNSPIEKVKLNGTSTYIFQTRGGILEVISITQEKKTFAVLCSIYLLIYSFLVRWFT